MRSDFSHIAEEVRREIDDLLSGIGILFRVFARGKDSDSLEQKLTRDPKKYSLNNKMIQDVIGVRVALYFPDDIPIVKSILASRFKINSSSSVIDLPESDQFSVTRYNLIFELSSEQKDRFIRIRGSSPLDPTFEVQLRSILSEGWHEVEHDLRYKAKDNWTEHNDLSRALNGVVATLESSEWSMGKIFDELAYRHYKNKNWQGMLPSLLRMRLRGEISKEISDALSSNSVAAKDLLKVDRASLLEALSNARPKLPVTFDNIVYFWNAIGPRHPCILSSTPIIVSEAAANVYPPINGSV